MLIIVYSVKDAILSAINPIDLVRPVKEFDILRAWILRKRGYFRKHLSFNLAIQFAEVSVGWPSCRE